MVGADRTHPKVQSSKDGFGQRNMLIHSGRKVKRRRDAVHLRSHRTVYGGRQGQDVASLPRPERVQPDERTLAQPRRMTSVSLSIVLATLLFAGLMSVALSAWFIYMRQFVGPGGASPNPRFLGMAGTNSDEVSPRLLNAESTRDAQQAEIVQLRNALDRTQRELATARAQTMLATATPLLASAHLEKPPLALILDAPVYKQEHSLSCEASAAAMAANFHGVSVSEHGILSALARHEDPHLGFRGNIDGPLGGTSDYGVYAEPVRQALAGLGLQAEHFHGGPHEIRAYIRQARPVIVWITYNLQAQSPRRVVLGDGSVVTLVPYEHTVLVVGYNRNGLWVNDPYAGTQDFYSEPEFARSFAYLGNMGLVVGPPVDG